MQHEKLLAVFTYARVSGRVINGLKIMVSDFERMNCLLYSAYCSLIFKGEADACSGQSI